MVKLTFLWSHVRLAKTTITKGFRHSHAKPSIIGPANAVNAKIPRTPQSSARRISAATPFILTYKDECPQLSSETVYPWTVEGGKPTVNTTSQCVAMMFDINGAKGPNKVGKDILATGNVTSIGNSCAGIELESGACMDLVAVPIPSLLQTECLKLKKLYPDVYAPGCGPNVNGLISATNYCAQQGKRLPTGDEMASILSEISGMELELDKRSDLFEISAAKPVLDKYGIIWSEKALYFVYYITSDVVDNGVIMGLIENGASYQPNLMHVTLKKYKSILSSGQSIYQVRCVSD